MENTVANTKKNYFHRNAKQKEITHKQKEID